VVAVTANLRISQDGVISLVYLHRLMVQGHKTITDGVGDQARMP
jgi:hypothetical protein